MDPLGPGLVVVVRRGAPLARRTPLDRGSALRRAALMRTTELARNARRRRRKTGRGEFSARVRLLLWLRFGVTGLSVPVDGFTKPVPLHELLAPYRRDLAGEQESRTAFLRDAHTRVAGAGPRRWSC